MPGLYVPEGAKISAEGKGKVLHVEYDFTNAGEVDWMQVSFKLTDLISKPLKSIKFKASGTPVNTTIAPRGGSEGTATNFPVEKLPEKGGKVYTIDVEQALKQMPKNGSVVSEIHYPVGVVVFAFHIGPKKKGFFEVSDLEIEFE